jgi:DNA polymerase II small subunit
MQAQDVIETLRQKNYLISPEALKTILGAENPEELAAIALENVGGKLIIEVDDLKIREKLNVVEKTEVRIERTDFKPLAKEIETNVKLHKNTNIKTSGTLEDFVDYFRSRYSQLADMLRGRAGYEPANISDLKKRAGDKVRIIAMVSEKRKTKNGHILLNIEDLTGTAPALIPQGNKSLIAFGESLILDEVIAIDGRRNKELFIVDYITQPDAPLKDIKTIEEDIFIAALSDFHIGSKLFMRKNFENFIAWLNGNFGDEGLRELAGKVKYVTIAGDLVDGIGVYPGQEDELSITDIYEQYEAVSDYVSQIPEYIHVII